jgi:hypothetical protein
MPDEKRGPGRPKGSKNIPPKKKKSLRDLFYSSSERYTEVSINKARQLAAEILEDEDYKENLKRRAVNGVLSPAIEQMLWYYLFGKPLEKIAVLDATEDSLESLTDAELTLRAKELHEIATEVMVKNQELEEPSSDLIN